MLLRFAQSTEHLNSMKNLSIEQIKGKISKLAIEETAVEFGFQLREPKKIDPVSFVGGFFMMVNAGKGTLNDWAKNICEFAGKLVSKQGVSQRLQFRQEAFAKQLLQSSLQAAAQQGKPAGKSSLFDSFGQVYLEDSTCIQLPDNLAEFFPGAFSHSGKSAVARIQLRLDLLGERYAELELNSYRDNDQGYAGAILSVMRPGDLCIRDMGYWCLEAFKGMAAMGAFFLSRLKPGVSILGVQGKEKMGLLPMLDELKRQGGKVLDIDILLGREARLPVRLVAIEVPQEVYQSRRRKALKDRNKKANHSGEYLRLLGWALFVTNVGRGAWSWKEIFRAYGFRWRIEVVFKCWKSKLRLQALFEKKESMSPARAVITFYLFLLWLTVFFVKWFDFFLRAVYASKGKLVSLLKFADFVKEHFWELLIADSLEQFSEIVAYYHTYEKRRKRSNFLEQLYLLKLT